MIAYCSVAADAQRPARQAWLLMVVLLVMGCERESPRAPVDQSRFRAEVLRVEAEGGIERYRFVARVAAAQTVDLAFEVSGPLAELPARPGERVVEGSVVARLELRDFELKVKEAAVAQRLAVADRDRKRQLLSQRGISRSDVDRADAEAELTTVRLAQAREALADATLAAPFDAYLAQRYLDPHSRVQAGEPVLRLLDLSELHLKIYVPEALAATASAERLLSAEATFSFAPDARFSLTFRENQGEARRLAQSFEITFSMPPPTAVNVLPGMTATVEVKLAPAVNAPVHPRVPLSAVVSDGANRYFVWRVDPASGNVERQAVSVGRLLPEGLEIVAGLAPGMAIVGAGAARVQAGMQIEPITAIANLSEPAP